MKKSRILSFTVVLITVLGVFFSSCKKDETDPLVATSVALVSGGDQSAEVSTALTSPVVVIVKDQDGKAFKGATVAFATTDGSVSAATGTTDAEGKATVNWTLGATVGAQILTVTGFKADGTTALTGSPISVTATGTAEPLVATSIELVSGSDQTAIVETALTSPVVVIVKDQNGDAFAGTEVSFAVTEGSVSAATGTTDADGQASVTWTLGTTVGTQTLNASATGLTGSPVAFSATGEAVPIVVGSFAEGGVVFYMLKEGDIGYDANVQHGLVCAVSNSSSPKVSWGCAGTDLVGADGTAIGTGAQNTIDIEAGCSTGGTAADICANLTLNGYDDWFLGSKDEIHQIMLNKTVINTTAAANGGSDLSGSYWSSSETGANEVWFITSTSQEKGTKDFATGDNVRAIRAF